jgi:hypothetical protein
MAAASSETPRCWERLRRCWVRCIASGRYDRLEGAVRVAGEEIRGRICEKKAQQACWAVTAERLLGEAEMALDRAQIDKGWKLLHAARRAEILALDEPKDVALRATVLREEADKLKSWRQKAIQRLLCTAGKPEAGVDKAAVFEAATLRDEHYDNQAYKDQLIRTQMLVLVLSLLAVMGPLLYILTCPGAGPGEGASDAPGPPLASFGVIALFGLLGAIISGMLRASDSGQSARIPELTATIRVTFMRIFMGSASAVIIYVFLESNLTSLFSDKIASAMRHPEPCTAYAIAFVAGFTERLVLRAVEAVAGKSENKSKTGGASS